MSDTVKPPHYSHAELLARMVAIETDLRAYKEMMGERDLRYTQRAQSQDDTVALALSNANRALEKADMVLEKRLDNLNELRGIVGDQSKEFARASEVSLSLKALEDRQVRVSELVQQMTARGGGMRDLWGYIIAALAVVGTLVATHPKG